jgi:hypothetical protein
MSKQLYSYNARPTLFEQRILKAEQQIAALRAQAAELDAAIARLSRLIDEAAHDRPPSHARADDPSLSCVSPR